MGLGRSFVPCFWAVYKMRPIMMIEMPMGVTEQIPLDDWKHGASVLLVCHWVSPLTSHS